MADNSEIAIGPYLKHLCDSSTCNVPRTTKYRWSKKAKLVSEREKSYPEERNLTKVTSILATQLLKNCTAFAPYQVHLFESAPTSYHVFPLTFWICPRQAEFTLAKPPNLLFSNSLADISPTWTETGADVSSRCGTVIALTGAMRAFPTRNLQWMSPLILDSKASHLTIACWTDPRSCGSVLR